MSVEQLHTPSCDFDQTDRFRYENRLVNLTQYVMTIVSDPTYTEPFDSGSRLHYVVIPRLHVAWPDQLPRPDRHAWLDEIDRVCRTVASPTHGVAVGYKLKPDPNSPGSSGIAQADHVHAHVVQRLESDAMHNLMGMPLRYGSFHPASRELIDHARMLAQPQRHFTSEQ